MVGQFLIRPGKIADQSRSLRRNQTRVQITRIGLLKGRLQRSMDEALAQRNRHIAYAARPQIELQSVVGVDLAVLGGLRLVSQCQLQIRLVEGLARDQLIRACRLHRVNGCRCSGCGVLSRGRPRSRIFREERLAKAEGNLRNAPGFLGKER